jgi:hypothetical protein
VQSSRNQSSSRTTRLNKTRELRSDSADGRTDSGLIESSPRILQIDPILKRQPCAQQVRFKERMERHISIYCTVVKEDFIALKFGVLLLCDYDCSWALPVRSLARATKLAV